MGCLLRRVLLVTVIAVDLGVLAALVTHDRPPSTMQRLGELQREIDRFEARLTP